MATVEITIDAKGYDVVSGQLANLGKAGVAIEKQFVGMSANISKSVVALGVYLSTLSRHNEAFAKTFSAVDKSSGTLTSAAEKAMELLNKYSTGLDKVKESIKQLNTSVNQTKIAAVSMSKVLIKSSSDAAEAVDKIGKAFKKLRTDIKAGEGGAPSAFKDTAKLSDEAKKAAGQLVKGLGTAGIANKKFADSINQISLSIQTLGWSTKRAFDQIKTGVSGASSQIKKDLKTVETAAKTATRNVINGVNTVSLSAQTMSSSLRRSFNTLNTSSGAINGTLRQLRVLLTNTSGAARNLARNLSSVSVSLSRTTTNRGILNDTPFKTITRTLSNLRIVALQAAAALAGYGAVNKLKDNAVIVDQLNFSFKAITGSTVAARNELNFIKDTAEKLGFVFYELADSYKIISAAARGTTLEGKGVRDLFEAITGAGAVMGSSTDDLSRVFLQLQQGIGRNKFMLEDLKRIMDALPGVTIKDLAKAVNATGYEFYQMVRKGQLISEDFIPKLVKVLQDKFGPAIEESKNRFSAYVASLTNSWNGFLEAVNSSFGRDLMKSSIEGIISLLDSMGEAVLESKDVFQEIGGGFKQAFEGILKVISDNKDINKWLQEMFSDPSAGEITFRSMYQNLSMLFLNFLANIETGFIKAMGYAEKFNKFLLSLHPSKVFEGVKEEAGGFWEKTTSGSFGVVSYFKNIGKEAEVATEKVSDLQQEFNKIDESVIKKVKDVESRMTDLSDVRYAPKASALPKISELTKMISAPEPPPDQNAANTEKALDRLQKKLEGITDTMRDKQLSVFDAAREKVKDLTLELNEFAKKGSNIERFPAFIKAAFDQINKAEIDKTIKDANIELEKLYEKMNPEKKTDTVFDEARDKIYEVIEALTKLKNVGAAKDPFIANLKSTQKDMKDYISQLNAAKNKADSAPDQNEGHLERLSKWLKDSPTLMKKMEDEKRRYEQILKQTPASDNVRVKEYKEAIKEIIKNIEEGKDKIDFVTKDFAESTTKQAIPKEVILKLVPIIENMLKLDDAAKELVEKGIDHFQDELDKLGPREVKFQASTAYNELYGVQEENLKKSNMVLEGLRLQDEENIATHIDTVKQLERSGLADTEERINELNRIYEDGSRKRHTLRLLELQNQEDAIKAGQKLEEDALLWENNLSDKQAVGIGFNRASVEGKQTENQMSAAAGTDLYEKESEYFGDYEKTKTQLKNQLEFLNESYEEKQKELLHLDEKNGKERLEVLKKIHMQKDALIELNHQLEKENEIKFRKSMREIYLNTETDFSFGDVWGGMKEGFNEAVEDMQKTWRQFGSEIGKTLADNLSKSFAKISKNFIGIFTGKTKFGDYSGDLSSQKSSLDDLKKQQGQMELRKELLERTGQSDTSEFERVSSELDKINDKITVQQKLFDDTTEKAKNSYKDLFDFISDGFSGLWDGVLDGFTNMVGQMAAAEMFKYAFGAPSVPGTGGSGSAGSSVTSGVLSGLGTKATEYLPSWGDVQDYISDSWIGDAIVNYFHDGHTGINSAKKQSGESLTGVSGLKSDELVAILQTGEAVLPRDMVKSINQGESIGKKDLDSLPKFHNGMVSEYQTPFTMLKAIRQSGAPVDAKTPEEWAEVLSRPVDVLGAVIKDAAETLLDDSAFDVISKEIVNSSNSKISEAAKVGDLPSELQSGMSTAQSTTSQAAVKGALHSTKVALTTKAVQSVVAMATNPDVPKSAIIGSVLESLPASVGIAMATGAVTGALTDVLGLDPTATKAGRTVGSIVGGVLGGPVGSVLGSVLGMSLADGIADALDARSQEGYLDQVENLGLGYFGTAETKREIQSAMTDLDARQQVAGPVQFDAFEKEKARIAKDIMDRAVEKAGTTPGLMGDIDRAVDSVKNAYKDLDMSADFDKALDSIDFGKAWSDFKDAIGIGDGNRGSTNSRSPSDGRGGEVGMGGHPGNEPGHEVGNTGTVMWTGGGVKAGELYKVGENGWEYFVPSTDGDILNHQQSKLLENKNVKAMAEGSVPGLLDMDFSGMGNAGELDFNLDSLVLSAEEMTAAIESNVDSINAMIEAEYNAKGTTEELIKEFEKLKSGSLFNKLGDRIQDQFEDIRWDDAGYVEKTEELKKLLDTAGKASFELVKITEKQTKEGLKNFTEETAKELQTALDNLASTGVDLTKVKTGQGELRAVRNELMKEWESVPLEWLDLVGNDIKGAVQVFEGIDFSKYNGKSAILFFKEVANAVEVLDPLLTDLENIASTFDINKVKKFEEERNATLRAEGKPEAQVGLEDLTTVFKGWTNINKEVENLLMPIDDLNVALDKQKEKMQLLVEQYDVLGVADDVLDEYMAKFDEVAEKMKKDFWREFTDKFESAVDGLITTGSKFQEEYDDLDKKLVSYIESLKISGYATEEITKLEEQRVEALKALEQQYQDAIKETIGKINSYMADYNVGGSTDFEITINKINKDFNDFIKTLSSLGAAEEVLNTAEQNRLLTIQAAIDLNKEAIQDTFKSIEDYTDKFSGIKLNTLSDRIESIDDDFDAFIKTLKSLGASEKELADAETERLIATQAMLKAEKDSIDVMRASILGLSEALKIGNVVERYSAGRNTDKSTGKLDIYDLASSSMNLVGGSTEDIMAFAEKMGVSPEQVMDDAKAIIDMYHSIIDPFVEIKDSITTWEKQLDETVKGSEVIAAKMMDWKADRGLPGEVYDMAAMNIDQYKEYANMMAEYVKTQISELQDSYTEFKDFSDSLEEMVTQIKKTESEKGLSTVQLAQKRDETITSKTQELRNSIDTGDLESLDSQLKLAGELKDLIEERYSMEADSIEALKDALASINDKIIELRYSSYNLAVPTQKAEVAAIDYSKMFAQAQTGDAESINEYLGFINTYLEQAQAAYKSSEKYQMIWDQVNQDLVSLGVTTEDAMTKEEMLLNSTISQLESLNSTIEMLLGKDGPINKTIQNLISDEGPIGKGVEGAIDLAKMPIENTLEAEIIQKNLSTINDSILNYTGLMAIDDKAALDALKEQVAMTDITVDNLAQIQSSIMMLDSSMVDIVNALVALPKELSDLYQHNIPTSEAPVPLAPVYVQSSEQGERTTVKATINITLEGGEVLTFHDIEIIADEVTTLKARRNKLAERIYL